MKTNLNNPEFKKELTFIINKYSLENDSDTPDFILAEYLISCLESFNKSCNKRSEWYGHISKLKNIN